MLFGLFLFWILSFKDVQPGLFFIRIFRVLNTVQFFIFKVHFVVAFVLSSNSFILSQLLAFVNNFFYFFSTFYLFFKADHRFSRWSFNIPFYSGFCQGIFSNFLTIFFIFFSYTISCVFPSALPHFSISVYPKLLIALYRSQLNKLWWYK